MQYSICIGNSLFSWGLSGLLGGTVIKTSIIGIFACAAAFIIQIACSMIMPVSLMSKGTLNDNLSSNE